MIHYKLCIPGLQSLQSLHCFIEAFQVRFQSDKREKSDGEIKKIHPQIGYNLAYSMSSTSCSHYPIWGYIFEINIEYVFYVSFLLMC